MPDTAKRRVPLEWHEVAIFPVFDQLPSKREPAVRVTMSMSGPLLISYEIGDLGPEGFTGRRFVRHNYMRRYLGLLALATTLVEESLDKVRAKVEEIKARATVAREGDPGERTELHGKLRVSFAELAKVSNDDLRAMVDKRLA